MLKQVGELGRIAGTLGSGGVREWLHRDGLASNRLMTDAAGSRVQHSHYLPHGDRSGPLTVDENGGPAAPESIGFIGERGDPDTNLLYLNARWYDPVLGRFLTPDWWDPTIPGVGTNRYAYAGNDRKRHRSGKRFVWLESGQLFTGDTEDDRDIASTMQDARDFYAIFG